MRFRLLLALLFACCLAVAAAAQAQSGPDTEFTPEPKPVGNPGPASQWAVLGGAEYGKDGELVKFSQTPYTVDFFATSFSPDGEVGLFGGWECTDPEAQFSELETCERQPTVYRLRTNEVGDTEFERVDLPGGGPGFVGSIAWFDDQRALAVGGTGTYPRREPVCPDEDPCTTDDEYLAYDRDHYAGDARAWIYEDTDGNGAREWRELRDLPDPDTGFTGASGDELPDEMAALTALDCKPPLADENEAGWGVCFAGGMQRLWRWDVGIGDARVGFVAEPVTGEEARLAGQHPDFHFRVRQVILTKRDDTGRPDQRPNVYASTSGCCRSMSTSEGELAGARIIYYSRTPGDPSHGPTSWSSHLLPTGGEAASGNDAPVPDSYFGMWLTEEINRGETRFNAVAVPGGPVSDAEAGSRIVSIRWATQNWVPTDPDLADHKLESLRLLSVGGDFAPSEHSSDWVTPIGDRAGMFDWAVGRFKATEQGVAYTTVPSIVPQLRPSTCPNLGWAANDSLNNSAAPNCDLAPENVTTYEVFTSRRLVAMPTYSLNSLMFVPGTQTGWAAGERGALVRIGGAGGVGTGTEPPAPQLRPQRPTALAAKEPFDAHRPSSATLGIVPPLASQPLETLRASETVAYGTADPTRWAGLRREAVSAIAMSRDGSEGWAIGSGGPRVEVDPNGLKGDTFTLQHFDGERWERCNVDGLAGAFDPDPRCSALAPLLEPKDGGATREPPTLFDIERIPLERDDDPTNDDEFEAIAVGSPIVPGGQSGPASFVLYRDGRWEIDRRATNVIAHTGGLTPGSQLAFRGPDDGWLMIPGTRGEIPEIYHYSAGPDGHEWPDGEWVKCGDEGADCGDGFGELPTGGNAARNFQLQVAGDAVFIAGERSPDVGRTWYPFVASKTGGGGWTRELDPGCSPPSAPPNCVAEPGSDGSMSSFAVTELGDGSITGWLMREIPFTAQNEPSAEDLKRGSLVSQTALMRRMPGDEPGSFIWEARRVEDAASRYRLLPTSANGPDPRLVSFLGADGGEQAFIMPARNAAHDSPVSPPFEYHAEEDRWQVMPVPFMSSTREGLEFGPDRAARGVVTAAAPDGQGGLWLTAEQPIPQGGSLNPTVPHYASFFYRYTTRRHEAVFEDAAAPTASAITDLDGNSDGTVWVATESDRLYRYDRVTGWEGVRIAGWDPGRVVTRPSSALAISVNEAGTGVAVGEQGRIADISPEEVSLDPAAGRRCLDAPSPCGTARDLVSVDVAPDGSALAGGEQLTLLWRPAGGGFRTASAPRASLSSTITGISMPEPGRAWVSMSTGEIFAGTLTGDDWRWVLESEARYSGDEIRREELPHGHAHLNAIAVDASGAGIAVGDRGAMLERTADGTWTRVDSGYLDNLHSVALPPDGYGDGVLVGGGIGLILTRVGGEFHTVRRADITDPLTIGPNQRFSARIVGLALAGGSTDGEVEAWAASQVPGRGELSDASLRKPPPGGLLRFGTADDPLLHPDDRLDPIPDAPDPKSGEVTLAAFGRSECSFGEASYCPEFAGTNLLNEVVSRRISSDIDRRRSEAVGPFASILTGDLNGGPGRGQDEKFLGFGPSATAPTDQNLVQEQWRETFADPLVDSEVPLFAVAGLSDLSRATACYGPCHDTQTYAPAGTTTQWQSAFATMPAPWGTAEPYTANGYTYRPLEETAPADTSTATGEGAHTHYALDVIRDSDEKPLARLVFADTSNLRSLTASDPNQNPVEPQSAWLEEVLCSEGSPTDAAAVDCTRPPGLPAVVVTTTPTYSYGPGGIDGTQTDAAAFEEILLRNKVTALVTGHLGWNGLYYTHAPGLHSPEPGGAHPDSEHPPEPPGAAAATGLLPTVVASSAGGRFGVDGSDDGSAAEGYWHGYSVVRIPANGDPKDVVVEQRPILDWIGIEGQRHVLRPRQKLVLGGYGREPLGTDTSVRIDRIENHAITHRFDLLAADPAEPWMPLTDTAAPTQADGPDPYSACGTYVCLTEDVGTIDPQSGEVRAGAGRHPGAYAIALLSVGEKAATYPIYFEKSPSFKAAAQPQPKLELKVATPPPPPGVETPPVPSFQSPTFNAPNLPTAPTLALPLALASTPASPPQPPVPPPAAPANPGPSPLDLSFAPTGLTVAPTASVIPPPAPPIQPAPPGGARKEARQRQAAAQKSGADGAEEAGSETQELGGDQANAPPTQANAASRQSPSAARQDYSFTRLERGGEGSAAFQLGAGLTLGAFVLALGFTTLGPRSRRREPEVPAPARVEVYERR